MAKKKGKKSGALADQKKKVVMDWERYIGRGELEDWQRLMHDLGFDEEFPSKSQCRKVGRQIDHTHSPPLKVKLLMDFEGTEVRLGEHR